MSWISVIVTGPWSTDKAFWESVMLAQVRYLEEFSELGLKTSDMGDMVAGNRHVIHGYGDDDVLVRGALVVDSLVHLGSAEAYFRKDPC